MPSAARLARGSPRSHAWIAVLASALFHLALTAYLIHTSTGGAWPDAAARPPMTVRLVAAAPQAVAPPGAQAPQRKLASQAPLPKAAPRRTALPEKEGASPERSAPPSLTSAPVAPQPAAAPPGPSTTELLDTVTKGVLKAAREKEARRELYRQADGAGQPDNGRTSNERQASGGRSERVHTLLGTYCVNTPNPATAYRSPNGVNIVGAGNCP